MKQVEESVREEPEVLEETIIKEIVEEKTIELEEEEVSNLLTTALVPLPVLLSMVILKSSLKQLNKKP